MSLKFIVDISTVGQGGKGGLALADPDCLGAFAKGTEGLHFEDPNYHAFYDAAKTHHKPCGPYMFLQPDEDGRAQARYLLAYTKPRPGDFEPVVDTETNSRGGMGRVAATTYAALDELKQHGFRPIMYGSTYFLKQLVGYEPRLKEFGVWQAEYGPVLHRIPGLRALVWQFTDAMVVAKGRLKVDGDKLLVRSIDALRIPKGKAVRHPEPPKPKPPVKPAAKRKPKGRDIPGAGDGTGGAYKPVVAKKAAPKKSSAKKKPTGGGAEMKAA